MSETNNAEANGVDRSFWPAIRVLVDKVRTGWIVFCVVSTFVLNIVGNMFVHGWIIAPAKQSDVDALTLRLEASTTSLRKDMEASTALIRGDLAKNTGDLADMSKQHNALALALAAQGANISRLDEGVKGVNARLDDFRQPVVKTAGAPAAPSPPPHRKPRSATKREEPGFTLFTRQ